MKTPEEIKKGLDHCGEDGCKDCPYVQDCTMTDGFSELAKDSLAYIQQLEAENERTMSCYDAAVCESADVAAMLPKWISVKDGLPEEHVVVLVARDDALYGREVTIGWCRCGRWEVPIAVKVTHWMPLPEPPEVNEK